MNGKDLFIVLGDISHRYYDEAEKDTLFSAQERGTLAEAKIGVQKTETSEKRRAFRRPFLIAAIIALMLLLVGCGVVYVLSMQDVKIGEATETRDYRLVDGTYEEDPHEVSENVLTLAGLKGSDAYQACADYYTFKDEYTKNMEAMMNDGTLPEGFFENGTYSKAMEDKAVELAEQYGLKLEGEILDFRTTRNMCDALGVERFLRDSQDLSAVIDGGGCYENGNFWLFIDFKFPEDKGYEVHATPGVLRWNRTDCFSADYVTIVDSGDWTERNYTTASGSEVLILQSPSQERGYIICDRGEALMSLQLDMNPEIYSEADGITTVEFLHMTDRQIELVADMMDFGIQPRTVTQEDVDNQPGMPATATQNGYTLALKSVETDGYVARILVSITAPEGTDIESLDISTGNFGNLTSVDERYFSGGSGAFNDVADGDGLLNTKDLLLVNVLHTQDGSMPYPSGSAWNLNITDLWVDKYYGTERILVEGEWLFPITFDETNGDYREIELISEPIKATACYGWGMDGTDALEEFNVTSFKLRKFSSEIKWDLIDDYHGEKNFGSSADFYSWRDHFTYAVMKDGTKIQMTEGENSEPIDLDNVDQIVLADGTKLAVPQS